MSFHNSALLSNKLSVIWSQRTYILVIIQCVNLFKEKKQSETAVNYLNLVL